MNTIATVSRPRWLTVVGVLGIVSMGVTVWLGLWVTPPDQVQGNLARLLYIHPPLATVALYWAGGSRWPAACCTCGPAPGRSSGTVWRRRPSKWGRCSQR